MNYFNPYITEIRDPRLELIESFVIKNTTYLKYYLHPKDSQFCIYCQSKIIQSYGTRIKQLKTKVFEHNDSIVAIKFHRYKCCNCGKIFHDECIDVEKNSSISSITKQKILQDLRNDLSFKRIANDNNVDVQTVINIFTKHVNVSRNKIPEVLCVDEFKNLKHASNKYAFLMYDPLSSTVIDVLKDRTYETISNYLYDVPIEERQNAKYFISDMYEGYRRVKSVFFSNATHIVDSFHYIRLVTDAFTSVRIRVGEAFPKNTWQYKMLKNNWRLLTLDTQKVLEKEIYNYKEKKKTSISEFINDAQLVSPDIKKAYETLQDFYTGWQRTKYEDREEWFKSVLQKFEDTELDEFIKVRDTFKKWKIEILNSFLRFGDKRLNNGYIEGINTRIKSIKKIAYGFRCFENLRARIKY